MAILTREEFLARLQSRIGEDTSDEALQIIEDFSDTFDDLAERASNDWETRYKENDAEWRRRYRERFFTGEGTTPETVKLEQEEDVKRDGEEISYSDLFSEREGDE